MKTKNKSLYHNYYCFVYIRISDVAGVVIINIQRQYISDLSVAWYTRVPNQLQFFFFNNNNLIDIKNYQSEIRIL